MELMTGQEELERLTQFLFSPQAQGYLFAVAEKSRDITDLNRYLMETGRSMGRTVKLFFAEPHQPLLPQLRAATQPPCDVLLFANLGYLLMADRNCLRELNHNRERLLEIPQPLVFWITTIDVPTVANLAADLYQRRRFANFTFPASPAPPAEERPPVAIPLFEDPACDQQAQEKLAAQQEWLTKLEATPTLPAEEFAHAYTDAAAAAWNAGQHETAKGYIIKARKKYEMISQFIRKKQIEEPENEDYKELSLPLLRLEGRIYQVEGDIFLTTGEGDAAIQSYTHSLKLYERFGLLSPPDCQQKARLHASLAAALARTADYPAARVEGEQAIALLRPLLHPQREEVIKQLTQNTYNICIAIAEAQYDFETTLTYQLAQMVLAEQALPANHPALAISYNNVGASYEAIGDLQKGLEYKERALHKSEQMFPANHPDLAKSYNNVGVIYATLGDLPKALEYFERSLRIDEQVLPANHPDLAMSYNNMGVIYAKLGDLAKALEYIERALRIREHVLPANHPDLATSYQNVGAAYLESGGFPKALEYLERALRIREQVLPANHPDLAMSYNSMGAYYSSVKNFQKKYEYLKKAFDIIKYIYQAHHPDYQIIYNNLRITERTMPHLLQQETAPASVLPAAGPDLAMELLLLQRGDTQMDAGDGHLANQAPLEALQSYTNALRAYQQVEPAPAEHLADAYHGIARAYQAQQQPEKALQAIAQAIALVQSLLPADDPVLQTYLHLRETLSQPPQQEARRKWKFW